MREEGLPVWFDRGVFDRGSLCEHGVGRVGRWREGARGHCIVEALGGNFVDCAAFLCRSVFINGDQLVGARSFPPKSRSVCLWYP
jgi:hypothetical protein